MELFKKVVINVQGLVKGEKFFSEVLTFIFDLESTSTASQFTFPASQKSKDLNKDLLLLQDLGLNSVKAKIINNKLHKLDFEFGFHI